MVRRAYYPGEGRSPKRIKGDYGLGVRAALHFNQPHPIVNDHIVGRLDGIYNVAVAILACLSPERASTFPEFEPLGTAYLTDYIAIIQHESELRKKNGR